MTVKPREGSQIWQINRLETGEQLVFFNIKQGSMSGVIRRADKPRDCFTVCACLIVTAGKLTTQKAVIVKRVK